MLNETAEQKEQRIFEHYKKDLLALADYGNKDHLRFNCIEYICHFPQIDPYIMAATLQTYGIRIDFDDSAISKAENERKRRKVQQHYKTLQ